MLTFIHMADVHLDAPLQSLSGLYERRQDDFRRTIQKVRDLVMDRQVDFWLIAGDLLEYHGGRRSTALFLRDVFASVDPIPVCIAPGNHDPWRSDSFYQTMEWPPNVIWFSPEWSVYEFPEKSCVVYGWGFPQPHVHESPLKQFPGKLAGYRHHLMVLHATVMAGEEWEHQAYAPIPLADLEAADLTYAALGHIHKPIRFIHPVRKTPFAAYPGSPEGLTSKEDGERCVLFGQVDEAGNVHLEAIPVQSRKISRREITVSGVETMESLIDLVERELADEESGNLLYVTLTGERPSHFVPALDVLCERFSRFFFIQFTDKSWPDLDVERLMAESSIWSRWLTKLDEAEADAADESAREIVRLARREALARIGGSLR
ncbi:metallophosphoesterase family protein [Brevibacillus sp. H7]|jgi:exonuclease SbcD|uniref:metallophosphoesterase family protein n=1 Tax=Brevibacillus sp. H7 TaxID=3349138 RepID=UPI00380B6F50